METVIIETFCAVFRISQGPPNAPDFKIHKAMERILKARGDMMTTR